MSKYLADTYGFVEALVGNPRYERIMAAPSVVTTAQNVMELHYALSVKGFAPGEVDRVAQGALKRVVEVAPEVAVQASRTRLAANQAQRAARSPVRMSYVDAWGYEAARSLGLLFLTGDPLFRRMHGVEFVR